MSELTITTPEHVPIRLEPAGAGSRFLAILIDALIVSAIASTLFGILSTFLPRGVRTRWSYATHNRSPIADN